MLLKSVRVSKQSHLSPDRFFRCAGSWLFRRRRPVTGPPDANREERVQPEFGLAVASMDPCDFVLD